VRQSRMGVALHSIAVAVQIEQIISGSSNPFARG
jgi:hypothetical protein